MVMNVLHLASELSDNPDLRDRGYIYWRMLSTDPTRTKDVVMAKRPEFSEDLSNLMDDTTLEIFTDFGIQKSAVSALNPQRSNEPEDVDSEPEEEEEKPKKVKKEKTKDKKKKKENKKEEVDREEVIETTKPKSDIDDIFGFGDEPAQDSQVTSDVVSDPLADIFGGTSSTAPTNSWENDLFGGGSAPVVGSTAGIFVKPEFSEVLSSSTPGTAKKVAGLQIKARFYQDGSGIKLDLVLYNSTAHTLSEFEILFNKNSFGLKPTAINIIPMSGGQTFQTSVDCMIDQANADMKNPPSCPFLVQTAIKCSLDVYYFQIP